MSKLYELADEANLRGKINAMFSGEHINSTEDRAVLHVATRAPRNKVINVDGKNIVPDVWDVLDKIKDFTEKVRNGEWLGHTGKPLTSVVAIGIGGCEVYRVSVGWSDPTLPEHVFQKLKPTYVPGDIGFDPLGLKPTDPAEFKDRKSTRLNSSH